MAKRKLVSLQEVKDQKAIKDDLLMQIEAGKKARDDKLTQLVEHIRGLLVVAGEKYLTVNGYMQARQTIEEARFDNDLGAEEYDIDANEMAQKMAGIADSLIEKLDASNVDDLDETILDGLLVEDFVMERRTIGEIAMQLLVVRLLQNVGPLLNELMQFRGSVDEGLGILKAELDKLETPETPEA